MKGAMSDRKAELERKKARLQAMREEKDRKKREKELKDVEDATNRFTAASEHRDLDEVLSSLGVAPVSEVLSSLSTVNSLTPDQSINHTPESSLQSNNISNSVINVKKKASSLSATIVRTVNIPPAEVVQYTKQTQTTTSGHERDGFMEDWWRPRKDEYNLNPGLEWEDEFTGEDEEGSLPHLGGFGSKLPPGILPHGLPQVKEVQPAVTTVEQSSQKEQAKEIRELSEEEKQMIILSEDFQRFVDRAGRIMERALAESVDIYADYAGMEGDEALDEKSHQRVALNRCFFDDKWSKNRCVTSLDWCPQYPELLLASYNNNEVFPNEPDGVALVWNTKYKKTTPEYIFHCQSPVLTAKFAKFHPNLILGGTYSGQIVLWDNRVQKRTPIQRTPLSAGSHTQPVYCMHVVGSQNAHNLISISNDGKLCSWSLDMLTQPQEIISLVRSQGRTVAATCLDFPHSDVNNFVIGGEEGVAFSACRHGPTVGILDSYDGHNGPITGISVNSVQGGIDFSHFFITSSMDWTMKLWSIKDSKPVYSFEDNGDYVMDVAWSPIHPALFASVDCNSKLDLWNLNQSTEVPAASITVDGNPGLNKVSWTPSGLHLTVGDTVGKISVYDVAENFVHPRHDEWNKFLYTTQELRNNQVDEDLEKLNLGISNTSLPNLSSLTTTKIL